MSPLERIRADLVERRLWPLAVLLVVALVATPVLLRRGADDVPPAAASAPVVTPADAASAQETVAAAGAVLAGTESSKARGPRRDPFARPKAATATASAPTAAAASPRAGAAITSPPAGVSSPARSVTVSKGSGSAATPAAKPATKAQTPARKATPPATDHPATFRLHRADIRFDDETVVHDAIRLRAFPSARAPLALYLGVTEKGKAAAFVISGGAQVSGDGTCRPRKRLCTHLLLKPGEEATLTVGETQHRLRLVRIRTDRTTSAKRAERFFGRASRKGRCVLDILDLLSFDAKTGTLAAQPAAGKCRYVFDETTGQAGVR